MSVNVERGLLLHQQGRYEMAEREFRAALTEQPGDPVAHSFLALCLVEREKYREATEEVGHAIRAAPDFDLPHSVMAYIFARRNLHREAEAAIREAIRINPFDAQHYALLADIKFELRDWPAALEAAEKGLEIDPDNVRCANTRAMALVKLGRRAEAGQSIEAALARDPDDATTHANRGWALLHDGQPRKAMEHFREALRLEPDHQWAKSGIVEALKAHNFIYRWMLLYFLWMARFSYSMQWVIIIGFIVGMRVLENAARAFPPLRPFVLPISIAYTIFAILTWIAEPFFNLLLRLNKFGRYALSRDQLAGSNLLLAMLLTMIGFIALGIWQKDAFYVLAGLGVFILALPASSIFRCQAGWPRYTLMTACAALAAVGGYGVFLHATGSGHPELMQTLRKTYVYGIIAASLGANFLLAARVTR